MPKDKAKVGIALPEQHTVRISDKSAKEGDAMSIIVVLVELLGEAVHMILINASHIGALFSDIGARFNSRRK